MPEAIAPFVFTISRVQRVIAAPAPAQRREVVKSAREINNKIVPNHLFKCYQIMNWHREEDF